MYFAPAGHVFICAQLRSHEILLINSNNNNNNDGKKVKYIHIM